MKVVWIQVSLVFKVAEQPVVDTGNTAVHVVPQRHSIRWLCTELPVIILFWLSPLGSSMWAATR